MTSYPTESRSERIKRRLAYAARIAGGAQQALAAPNA